MMTDWKKRMVTGSAQGRPSGLGKKKKKVDRGREKENERQKESNQNKSNEKKWVHRWGHQ